MTKSATPVLSVLEIVRELRMTHPSIGVKKLVNAAKKATKYTHPDWKVGSKDVRAALSSLETEKATMTKAPKEDLIIYQSSLPDSEGEEEYDPMKEVINSWPRPSTPSSANTRQPRTAHAAVELAHLQSALSLDLTLVSQKMKSPPLLRQASIRLQLFSSITDS